MMLFNSAIPEIRRQARMPWIHSQCFESRIATLSCNSYAAMHKASSIMCTISTLPGVTPGSIQSLLAHLLYRPFLPFLGFSASMPLMISSNVIPPDPPSLVIGRLLGAAPLMLFCALCIALPG